MKRTWLIILLLSVAVSGRLVAQGTAISGVLSVLYGDQRGDSLTLFQLETPDGQLFLLDIPPSVLADAGGIVALQGVTVTAALDSRESVLTPDGLRAIPVVSLTIVGEASRVSGRLDVLGSQEWVNLLCRFPDAAGQPFTPAEITSIFSDDNTRWLDDYWQEVSYGKINIPNVVTTNWVNLPHTRSYYLALPNFSYLDAIFNDCTAAHNASVNYGDYFGINLFFNSYLDGYYWGTECEEATLDGIDACWRTTWLPYYGYFNFDMPSYAHEMGHAYGLPHSNNSDGDDDPYDNMFDIMSGTPCINEYNGYWGCLQQHTIAYHKYLLGWIEPANMFSLTSPGSYAVTLDRLAKPESTNTYLALIPIDASHFYTVEARRRDVPGYEQALSSSGVIIHEVDLSRDEPAWQVQAASDGTSAVESGVFLPGETYVNTQHDFAVRVDSETTDGYAVTLIKGEQGAPPDLRLLHTGTTITPGKAQVNLNVTNLGPTTARNAVISFDLVYEVYLNMLTGTTGCTQAPVYYANSFVCPLGNLAPGASASVSLDLRPWNNGSINVPAVVVSNETEDVTNNNRVTINTASVTARPDLVVEVDIDRDAVLALGEQPNYAVYVYNVGGTYAEDVTVTLNAPAGYPLTSYGFGPYGNMSEPDCTVTSSQITCHLDYIGSYYDAVIGEYGNTQFVMGGYNTVNTYGDKTLTATATTSTSETTTSNNSGSDTVHVGTLTAVTVQFALQGRPPAPSPQYIEGFDLIFYRTGEYQQGNVHILGGIDEYGKVVLPASVLTGTYRLYAKSTRTLSVVQMVTLTGSSNTITLGLSKTGDANDDNAINLTDFSILASTFGTGAVQGGFDDRADFNGDGQVNLIDFSLLASNYGQQGQS